MLATRVPLLSRAIVQFARNGKSLGVLAKNNKQLQLQSVRFSGDWTYRTGRETNPLSKRIIAQVLGGCKLNIFGLKCLHAYSTHQHLINSIFVVFSVVVMWWWVIWHLYWDWGHIVGEFPYPDASAWTDAELGIPPDDIDE